MTSPQPSPASYRVVVDTDVAMQTRDGVTLYADVYRPDADGFPFWWSARRMTRASIWR